MTDPIARLNAALEGRYTIESELGEGGMATVYLARDLKHERKVALKVLKPELAAVVGAERFLAEIKTTANLQHPNILALYDSGEADGFLFYVMPYIEGETLRDKLDRETQLGIDESVMIATEIADALDYAHRQNIIHRDIKPANILLHDGRPIVADFGIALALSEAGGGRMTETGLSLGTPHYMSPEQAMAEKDVTARSDVYSLGSVLYEMLTGEPPHTGGSAQAIIMKIVTDEARPITELRKSVPLHVAAATAKALEKLAADRFESAAKFAEALRNAAYPVPSIVTGTPTTRMRRFAAALPWFVSAAALLGLWFVTTSRDSPDPSSYYLNIALPDANPLVFIGEATYGVGQTALTVSPDGKLVAYVGQSGETTQLFVRSLGDFATLALPGTAGAYGPFFDPTGEWIAFFEEDELKRVSVITGDVTEVAQAYDPYGGSWSGDDRIVMAEQDGGRWTTVPARGGTPGYLPWSAPPSIGNHPQWLPGDSMVLHACGIRDQICVTDILRSETRFVPAIGSTSSGGDTLIGIPGTNPRYVPTGHLVYARPGDNVVMAIRFDHIRLEARGEPVELFRGVRRESPSGAIQLAFSQSGMLVYAAGQNAETGVLVWADPSGSLDSLPLPRGTYGPFTLSPDRRTVAIVVLRPLTGENELVVLDVASRRTSRWPGTFQGVYSPAWDASSESIILTHEDSLERVLLRVNANATGRADTLYRGPDYLRWNAALSDGRVLFDYTGGDGDTSDSYFTLLTLEELERLSGAPPRLFDMPGAVVFGGFSPDERWLTFTSKATGRYEVFAVRFPELGAPIQISTDGGERSVWTVNQDALFYRDGQRWYRVPVPGNDGRPFGDPEFYLEGDFLNVWGTELDVAADGRRLLLLLGLNERTTNTLNVVTDWFAILNALLPNDRN